MKQQLFCKAAGISKRASVLNGTGCSSMLWSIESTPLTRSVLSRLNGCFVRKVAKMLQKRWHPDAIAHRGDFMHALNSQARNIIRRQGADIFVQALRRQWRFLGHLARSDDRSLIEILMYRDFLTTRERVRSVRARSREFQYREGKQQRWPVDRLVSEFYNSKQIRPWNAIAHDRARWRAYEDEFINFSRTLLEKDAQ
eukprot:10652538-Karenia_brevis.AAC.1